MSRLPIDKLVDLSNMHPVGPDRFLVGYCTSHKGVFRENIVNAFRYKLLRGESVLSFLLNKERIKTKIPAKDDALDIYSRCTGFVQDVLSTMSDEELEKTLRVMPGDEQKLLMQEVVKRPEPKFFLGCKKSPCEKELVKFQMLRVKLKYYLISMRPNTDPAYLRQFLWFRGCSKDQKYTAVTSLLTLVNARVNEVSKAKKESRFSGPAMSFYMANKAFLNSNRGVLRQGRLKELVEMAYQT